MVVPPLQCSGGDMSNDMESLNRTPIVTISSDSETEKTENGKSTRRVNTRSSAKKGVEEKPEEKVVTKKGEVEEKKAETPAVERRQSARIKSLVKEREEKEQLAKKSAEASEVREDESENTRKRKRKSSVGVSGSEKKRAGVKNEERERAVVEEEKKVEVVEEEEEKEKKSGENGEVSGNLGLGLGLENGNERKSDNAKVKETLRLFNSHYLHFVQEEEKRCEAANKGSPSKKPKDKLSSKKSKDKRDKVNAAEDAAKKPMKRPDLKAITKMMETSTVLFPEKRFGDIPGIRVGHQFYSRAEMVVLGFHSHWLNGIDYMGQAYKATYPNYEFPIATAIVMSGMYEDDLDNAEDIVYTGQGGHNLTGDKRQIKDQELTRGNLALKNCIAAQVPVRVVRGHESSASYSGRVYTYDGLYQVVKYWAEKGLSGFTVYKFMLKRIKGQPLLTTNQVQFIYGRVPKSLSELRGLVCEDITNGKEAIPIPATNLVDDPPVPPTGYRYIKSIQAAKNVTVPSDALGCGCKGSCTNPKTCECARLNGSDFPYVQRDGGRLIEAKDVVYECGPKCGCGPDCVNRVSQRGLKYRLEVFRAPRKGWAVRSWDFIPSGAPVCEYIGTLRRSEDLENASQNDYIFDIDCLLTMRGIGGRERRSLNSPPTEIVNQLDGHDDLRSDAPEFCIDAGSVGNIARFINHSCEPNLFVQCVLSSHRDFKLARVVLIAADNIPPLQELTYDYGYELDSVRDANGKVKKMPCYCGAADCRKRLF